MIRIAEDAGYDFSLLRGVIAVNDEQFERVTEKVAALRRWLARGRARRRTRIDVQGRYRRPS